MDYVTRIAFVAAVLYAAVLRDRFRVGQLQCKATLDQSVDQPKPVGNGLDHHASQIISVRLQQRHDSLQVVRSTSLTTRLVVVDHR